MIFAYSYVAADGSKDSRFIWCDTAYQKISDLIHFHSSWKFTPHPMTPDSTMVTVPIFVRHDSIIEATRLVNGRLYGLMAGHKRIL